MPYKPVIKKLDYYESGGSSSLSIGDAIGSATANRFLTTDSSGNLSDDPITSDDITEGSSNLFLTSAERTVLSNTSGVNTGDQDLSGYALTSNLATVATSGDYNDLDNLPSLLALGETSSTAHRS